MYPHLLEIGPFSLRTYGLMVALGFLVGYGVARREFERHGLMVELVDKVVLVLMVGGILGARLFYAFQIGRAHILEDPLSFFRLWEGGLVYYGGFLVAVGVLILYARNKDVPFLALIDSLVAPLFIAHALGRLGCFAAGCCYGRPTDSFLGVTYSDPLSLAPTGLPLLPTQLFSALVILILFLGAQVISRRGHRPGMLLVYYVFSYGSFRFLIEFLRDDFRGAVLAHLHPSQWISLGLLLMGGFLWAYVKRQQEA